jgi:hypothetical protein
VRKSFYGIVLLLVVLGIVALEGPSDRPRIPGVFPEARAQSSSGNTSNYEDSRYFTSTSGTMTGITVVTTANYTNGVATTLPNGVNHVLKGGWVSSATAGAITFYSGGVVSAANYVFSLEVPANTTFPFTDALIQKGIPFGLGNPIEVVGPGVTQVGLWVRDDPK